MKHISAALQTESMIPEQMRKENIRRIGINSVLFLSIHYPVKWVVSGAVSFDVLSIISSIYYRFSTYISFVMLYIKGLTVCGEQSYYYI